MAERSFTCAVCGHTYRTTVPRAEMIARYEALYQEPHGQSESDVVCEACAQPIYAWIAAGRPVRECDA